MYSMRRTGAPENKMLKTEAPILKEIKSLKESKPYAKWNNGRGPEGQVSIKLSTLYICILLFDFDFTGRYCCEGSHQRRLLRYGFKPIKCPN